MTADRTVNERPSQNTELWAPWCDEDGMRLSSRLHYITSCVVEGWTLSICGSRGMGYALNRRKRKCGNCERALAAARAGRSSPSAIARWTAQPRPETDGSRS